MNRLTIYERDKADKERRVREEAARVEREEAQRLQAIADERERASDDLIRNREFISERAADTDAALDYLPCDRRSKPLGESAPSRCRCAPSRCRCRSCRKGGEREGGATSHHARRLWIIQFASHFLGFYRPGQGRAGPRSTAPAHPAGRAGKGRSSLHQGWRAGAARRADIQKHEKRCPVIS